MTTLKITEKDCFYTGRRDARKGADELWNQFSLFRLRFVLDGSQSAAVKRKHLDPRVRPCVCVVCLVGACLVDVCVCLVDVCLVDACV